MKINITFNFSEDDLKTHILDKEDDSIKIKCSKSELNKAIRQEMKEYIEKTVFNYLWSDEMGIHVRENLEERELIE